MSSPVQLPAAWPFTGMALDRASSEREDPARIGQLREDPDARAVAAGRDGVLVCDRAGTALLRARLPDPPGPEPILLGLERGTALFAVDLEELPASERAAMTDGGRVLALREAGAALPHSEAGLAAYLVALLNWHRSHRFCANCGAATAIGQAGYSRRCPRCETVHFPRTDPVVIMTVEHQRRLLLGRRVGWPAGRGSLLAGFVSPGESAEEAVIREVHEESGILAHDPRFVTSQPWPFPSSLMLGFEAQSDGGEPHARDGELEEVGWFAFEAVRAAAQDRNPDLQLPPRVSVARLLIERWVALQLA
ncbi:MAG: NAD(+) diphosphatase [Solirubrobacterales bacterium]|nr:NAD(+) diphosphatase [Solirubrobacterales bacterium]